MGNAVAIQSANSFMSGMGGNMAQKFLQSGLKVNTLRTNAVLRKEEWIEFDKQVVLVARQRLNGIADLQSRGLIQPLGGLGTIFSQWEQMSDMTGANINMSGVTQGEQDDVEFSLKSVPVPIVHKDFSINIRRLEASRRLGDGADTTQAEVASRRVTDGLESLLFKGAGIILDGSAIHGYTTHPNRNTGSAADFGTIGNIYTSVLNMVKDAQADHFYGPYMLYVAADQYTEMLTFYTDGSGQTALTRCKQIPGIADIKPSDELASGSLVLVQMTKDVVDLAVAQDIVTIEWNTLGGMQSHFKVMCAMVPRLKADADGRMGLVHYTGA